MQKRIEAARIIQLPFRGGGYLHMEFGGRTRGVPAAQAEKSAWHVLHTVLSEALDHVQQIKYIDRHLMDAAENRLRKKRRIELQQVARRDIHQQKFAYYQVLSMGCGVNLLRDPSDADTIGLVRGVCLLYAHRRSIDPVEGSALFSIEAAKQTPLSGADHTVKAYFRPRGICEWNGGRCNRHNSPECANACCSAAHCIETSSVRQIVCNYHHLT